MIINAARRAFALAALTFPGWIFRRHGFKMTIAVGLFTYGAGCMVFWPSSITQTFPGLLFSMIIIGTGSGIIDLSSSTFVVLLGPQEYAEVRLNIFQGIQAVGGLMPLLSQSTAFYASVGTLGFSTLLVVQWLFLGCGYAAFFMAGVICCVRLPEFQDPEPPFRSSSKSLFRSPYGLGFFLALWALFFYCGGQEITRIYARNYLVLGIHTTNELALRLEKSGQAVFAAGRFIAAILMLLVRPCWLLLAFTLGLLIVSAIAITHSALQGDIVYALNLFFQGTIYPTIFVLAIRGVGRHIKTAAILLVAALGMGAAVLPIVFYPVNKKEGTMQAYAITIAAFGALLVYPLYLCAVPSERERTKRFDDELDGLFFWKTRRSSDSVAGFGVQRRRSI
jgi:FHS family L-fucose permease-like MFS transporter